MVPTNPEAAVISLRTLRWDARSLPKKRMLQLTQDEGVAWVVVAIVGATLDHGGQTWPITRTHMSFPHTVPPIHRKHTAYCGQGVAKSTGRDWMFSASAVNVSKSERPLARFIGNLTSQNICTMLFVILQRVLRRIVMMQLCCLSECGCFQLPCPVLIQGLSPPLLISV